jgi:hypothetical protein
MEKTDTIESSGKVDAETTTTDPKQLSAVLPSVDHQKEMSANEQAYPGEQQIFSTEYTAGGTPIKVTDKSSNRSALH